MAWHGDEAKARIEEAVARKLIAAAIILQTEHMADLSTGPPPSARGEFPHYVTHNLRSAVDYEPKNVAAVAAEGEVRVGYQRRAWYILALIKIGRKSLRDTLERVRARMQGMLGGNAGNG